jgi:hypothetical protein
MSRPSSSTNQSPFPNRPWRTTNLVAGLGDEDLVLDADARAAVPLRRALPQDRHRWDINPGLDRYDLRTRTSQQPLGNNTTWTDQPLLHMDTEYRHR